MFPPQHRGLPAHAHSTWPHSFPSHWARCPRGRPLLLWAPPPELGPAGPLTPQRGDTSLTDLGNLTLHTAGAWGLYSRSDRGAAGHPEGNPPGNSSEWKTYPTTRQPWAWSVRFPVELPSRGHCSSSRCACPPLPLPPRMAPRSHVEGGRSFENLPGQHSRPARRQGAQPSASL